MSSTQPDRSFFDALFSSLFSGDFNADEVREAFATFTANAPKPRPVPSVCPPPEDPEDEENEFIPQGKGLTFVSLVSLRDQPKGTDIPDEEEAENTAKRLQRHGFTWVKLLLEKESPQAYTVFDSKLPTYAAILREHGIDTWGWGWPLEGRHEWFVDEMLRQVERTGIRGIVVNAEQQWRWNRDSSKRAQIEKECEYVFSRLKQAGLGLAPSTFGNIQGFGKHMPMEIMAEYSDFVQIQLYTSTNPALRVKQARELGFDKVIPVLGTVAPPKGTGTRKAFDGTRIPKKGNTPESMAWRLTHTPHDGGLNWWQATALRWRKEDFRKVIASHEIDGPFAGPVAA